MASPVDQKDFFTGTGDLDRSTGAASEFAGADFMGERVCFATEAATHIGSNHADVRWWQLQYLTDFAVHVVRCLSRGPEGELAANRIAGIGFPIRNAGVRLHRSMVVALIIEPILTN